MAALLEHLKMPGDALREILRLLEPGGRLLLTTPTPLGGRIHKITSYLGFDLSRSCRRTREVLWEDEFNRLLEIHGFEVQVFKSFLFGLNQFVIARKKE